MFSSSADFEDKKCMRYFIVRPTEISSSYDKFYDNYTLHLTDVGRKHELQDVEIILRNVEEVESLIDTLTSMKKLMLMDNMSVKRKPRTRVWRSDND